ncbi:MAG: hypothetical protein Q9204_008947, partial [Flavoplaca sp. TL-2023a]
MAKSPDMQYHLLEPHTTKGLVTSPGAMIDLPPDVCDTNIIRKGDGVFVLVPHFENVFLQRGIAADAVRLSGVVGSVQFVTSVPESYSRKVLTDPGCTAAEASGGGGSYAESCQRGEDVK